MNENVKQIAQKYNALSTRERIIISTSLVVVILYLWWTFLIDPRIVETAELEKTNSLLATETQAAILTNQSIEQRLAAGVHKDKLALIELNEKELERVNARLDAKAYELIEPEQMFDLMKRLVFADSGLKLVKLSRKEVAPVFGAVEGQPKAKPDEPAIYRHTMSLNLQGGYADILRYVETVEEAGWKLIWDSIRLKTEEYPLIAVEIEMSTLSKSQQWVGL